MFSSLNQDPTTHWLCETVDEIILENTFQTTYNQNKYYSVIVFYRQTLKYAVHINQYK